MSSPRRRLQEVPPETTSLCQRRGHHGFLGFRACRQRNNSLAAGSFTITGANGTVTTISTGTGTSTLNDVATTINSDNLGSPRA